jgi:hypothetical protein
MQIKKIKAKQHLGFSQNLRETAIKYLSLQAKLTEHDYLIKKRYEDRQY